MSTPPSNPAAAPYDHKAHLFHRYERPLALLLLIGLIAAQIVSVFPNSSLLPSIQSFRWRNGGKSLFFKWERDQMQLWSSLQQICQPQKDVMCHRAQDNYNWYNTRAVPFDSLMGPLFRLWRRKDRNLVPVKSSFSIKFNKKDFIDDEEYPNTNDNDDKTNLPEWIKKLDSKVFETNFTLPLPTNRSIQRSATLHGYNFTWNSINSSTFHVQRFDYNDTILSQTYQYTGKFSRLVYHAKQPNLQHSLQHVIYRLTFDNQHDTLQLNLHCCAQSKQLNQSQIQTRDIAYSDMCTMWSAQHSGCSHKKRYKNLVGICSPSVCMPKQKFDQTHLLKSAWKLSLLEIISRSNRNANSLDPSTIGKHYKYDDLVSIYGNGTATMTVSNLVHFFHDRKMSKSPTLIDVMAGTDFVATISKEKLELNQFMSIVEEATRELDLHPQNYTLKELNNFDLNNVIIEQFLESIQSLRSSKWNTTMIDAPLKKHSRRTFLWQVFKERQIDGECLMDHFVGGSLVCQNALTEANELMPLLPNTHNEYELDHEEIGFMNIIALFLILFSCLQILIRFNQLPGGHLTQMEAFYMVKKNRQLRMALDDEYLWREREHHATKQLGEEGAQEVMSLLVRASKREPRLAKNHQAKNRKASSRLAAFVHIMATLTMPFFNMQVYGWCESILLALTIILSMLEVMTKSRLEKAAASAANQGDENGNEESSADIELRKRNTAKSNVDDEEQNNGDVLRTADI